MHLLVVGRICLSYKSGKISGKLYLYFAPNTKKKFKGAVRVVEVSFPGE